MTIAAEALAPLPPLGFVAPNTTTGTDGRESVDEFYASLPQLRSNTSPAVLQPQTPIYLLLRHAPTATAGLTALTYIPSNAGVRAKTLFAATRASLVRELGSEKFAATVFATDEDEVVGEAAWRERELAAAGDSYDQLDSSSPSGIGAARTAREELMGDQERELERVRRAVEEARVSSISRDIGIGGTFKRQQGAAGAGAGAGASMAVAMAMDDQARDALRGLQQGCLVQLVCLFTCLPAGRLVEGVLCLSKQKRKKTKKKLTQTGNRHRDRDVAAGSEPVGGASGVGGNAHFGVLAPIHLLPLSRVRRGHLHLYMPSELVHQRAHAVCQHAHGGAPAGRRRGN